jgi:hypothetical protein
VLLEGVLRVGCESVTEKVLVVPPFKKWSFYNFLTVTTVYDVKAVLKIRWLLDIRLQWLAFLHMTMDIYTI